MVCQAVCPPQGNCKSVIGLEDGQQLARGRCGQPQVGKSPQIVRRIKEPHTGGVSWSMEGMERVFSPDGGRL